ncbi:MAG: cytochrome c4 [Kangiellaceae bacterium]|nr:cytochrome c4 [Kangiellaceae bacterium]
MSKIIGLVLAALFSNQILAGDAVKGKEKTTTCLACHGADGNSPLAINPKLAGQGQKYLVKQLKDFKSKARDNATMFPMASMLNDEDIENVATYYAEQKVQHTGVDEKYLAVAEKIYRGGDADRDIPACIACHGANGEGMSAAGFPAVGGQHPTYTMSTLKAFRSGARANDANGIMRDIVAKMSDEQIEALANYLAGLH